MADLIYNAFPEAMARGVIGDVETEDAFKMMLVTDSYTPNKDSHNDRADVTNEVAATGGYTAGGKVVTCAVTRDDATDRVTLTFGAESWADSTITAAGAVVYFNTGTAADDILVFYNDFGGDVTTSSTTFSVGATTIPMQN
jgi:hypothetical protein